jgi:hypothetical protein
MYGCMSSEAEIFLSCVAYTEHLLNFSVLSFSCHRLDQLTSYGSELILNV